MTRQKKGGWRAGAACTLKNFSMVRRNEARGPPSDLELGHSHAVGAGGNCAYGGQCGFWERGRGYCVVGGACGGGGGDGGGERSGGRGVLSVVAPEGDNKRL